jgi:NADP-dependent 3-hydroxy acid dehydrogenase YdfG
MNILCTGNPDKLTIAWAAKQKWNQVKCISLSSGWDLKLVNQHNKLQFSSLIRNFDVFINSSFIAPNVQSQLLTLVCNEWMAADIKGHIITIGTTLEMSEDKEFQLYINDKRELRNLSLDLSNQTAKTGVKTTYVVVGGINNQQPNTTDFVDPCAVVDLIDWSLNFSSLLPLIQIEKNKVQNSSRYL